MSIENPQAAPPAEALLRPVADPAETVTLVLTDVVDSTQLAARLGDAKNAALWDAHDRAARNLVARWNGREVERTDGILALFDSSKAALAFARGYLEALRALDPPLEARVGVHRGPLVVRANPSEHVRRGAKALEADGLALSVTARVAAVARGGQVLLTKSAVDEHVAAKSRGHWHLKGAPEPLELFALDDEARAMEPLAEGDKAFRVVKDGEHWVPVRQIPRTLPAEWDGFFGRAAELRDIAAHLEAEVRLLTLSGLGGSGKTRLACRHAWLRLAEYPGGIWFCNLVDARSEEDVVRAVAATLGVPLDAVDAAEQLGHAIAGRGRCLLVLDNFEQVVAHGPATVGRWLGLSEKARFLVTSRERLDLPGEVVMSLDPLGEDEAVRLFAARAAAAKPGYAMRPEEEADVRALVGRLDLLPLAIELTAPRIRVLSVRELLDRLVARLDASSEGGRRQDRQATLRATLDWSWDLLDAEARAGLARLSVFEGGFTLAAAEAVLEGSSAVDVVQALVDRSLVRRAAGDRFDLLRVVRVYAAEKLDRLGGRDEIEARHGRYFARLGTREVEDLPAQARELDNLVAACHRAVRRGDIEVALPALRAVWAITDRQGPASLAADLTAEVGELPGLQPGLRDRLAAEALLARGSYLEGQRELRLCLRRLGHSEPRTFLGLVGRILTRVARQLWRRRRGAPPRRSGGDTDVPMAATRAYQRLVETYWFSCRAPRMLGAALSALDLCEPLGPSPELARAYATLALATSGLRFDTAADRYAALALNTAEGSGAPLAEAYVRFLACVYRVGHGRFDEVSRDLGVAIDLFARGQDHRLLGDARTVRAMLQLYRGDFRAGFDGFVEVIRAGERQGNDQHQVWGMLGSAEALLRLGNPEAARTQILNARIVLERFPSPAELARSTGVLARVELELGRPESADAYAAEAARQLEALGPPTAHYLLEGYASVAEVRLLRGRLRRASKPMKGFAKTFPIGEPRLAWLEAEALRRRGKTEASRRRAEEGHARAEALGMRFEAERLAALLDGSAPEAGERRAAALR